MIGLAILELLWGLDPDLYLLSEEPFLWVWKGENHAQTCESKLSEKQACPNWKGRFSRTCTGVIGVTLLRQTDLWCFLIDHSFMTMVEFSFLESLTCLDSLSASLSVILIFRFKRYCQIFLLIAVNSWFFVPHFSLSVKGLSCCPCACELILHPFPLMWRTL